MRGLFGGRSFGSRVSEEGVLGLEVTSNDSLQLPPTAK